MNIFAKILLAIFGIIVLASASALAILVAASTSSWYGLVGAGFIAYLGGAIASGIIGSRFLGFLSAATGITNALALITLGLASAVSSLVILPPAISGFMAFGEVIPWIEITAKSTAMSVTYCLAGFVATLIILLAVSVFSGGSSEGSSTTPQA
jgi:hypothetical protein